MARATLSATPVSWYKRDFREVTRKADGPPSAGVRKSQRHKTGQSAPRHGLPFGDRDWLDRHHEENLEILCPRIHANPLSLLDQSLTRERNSPRSGPTDGVPARQRAQARGYRQQRVFPFFLTRTYHINHIHEENNGSYACRNRCYRLRVLTGTCPVPPKRGRRGVSLSSIEIILQSF
jgi:hypothetical protein